MGFRVWRFRIAGAVGFGLRILGFSARGFGRVPCKLRERVQRFEERLWWLTQGFDLPHSCLGGSQSKPSTKS